MPTGQSDQHNPWQELLSHWFNIVSNWQLKLSIVATFFDQIFTHKVKEYRIKPTPLTNDSSRPEHGNFHERAIRHISIDFFILGKLSETFLLIFFKAKILPPSPYMFKSFGYKCASLIFFIHSIPWLILQTFVFCLYEF